MNALAIDLGTGGPKVAIVDVDGHILGSAQVPVHTSFGPYGAAEQDPEELWLAVASATRLALAQAPDSTARSIDIVYPTGQWSSIVPVDSNGRATAPMLVWMDRRGANHTAPLLRNGGKARWLDIHGMVPRTGSSIAHILYYQHDQPDVHYRTRAYLEPVDYLGARMTGVIATTANAAMPLSLSDHRTLGSWGWSDELIERSGVDRTRLAPFVPAFTILGPLRGDAAADMGLPPGVQVAAGCNDSIAAAFGSGALDSGEATVVMGTTAVLTSHHRTRIVEHNRFILSMPSVLDDRYYVVAEGGMGGKALELFATRIGYPDDGVNALPHAVADADVTAAGANGVMYLPWLMGSASPAPDEALRGGFFGVGLGTVRADMARAVMEGVALQVAWLAEDVQTLTAHSFARLRFAGGGALSHTWAQILADACALPVEQLHAPRHANARGAGILGHMAAGRLTLDEVRALVPLHRRYEPNPTTATLYSHLRSVFTQLHSSLHVPSAQLQETAP